MIGQTITGIRITDRSEPVQITVVEHKKTQLAKAQKEMGGITIVLKLIETDIPAWDQHTFDIDLRFSGLINMDSCESFDTREEALVLFGKLYALLGLW